MSGGCVDVHRLTEVVRTACIHDLVCESCNFVVYSEPDWKPMKFLQHRVDVVLPSREADDASEGVLCTLKLSALGFFFSKFAVL